MDEYDVFISYAHRDNQPLLQTDSEKGWVSSFDEILNNFLTRELGRTARIWRDRNNQPGDYFGDKIRENLLRSKAFILILSPSYVSSEWCQKEFELYLDERKPIRIEDKSCVFPIFTKPVEEAKIPPKWNNFLKEVLAAEFFKREGEDKTLTLNLEYGDEQLKRELLKKIDFLAQDISLLLRKGVTESLSEPSALKPFLGMKIYMAEPSPDLWDDYQKIRRDFIKRGAIVLPSSFDFSRPEKIEDYQASMLADLKQCQLIVHFIGSTDAEYSEEQPQSLAQLQINLAAEYQAGANCTRLIFVPQTIVPASESHAQFIGQLSEMTSRNVDLLRTPLDLRTEMENALTGKPKPSPVTENAVPTVYILHDAQDGEAVNTLVDKLFGNGCEVWTVSQSSEAGDVNLIEEHKAYLLNCDAALVYWNKAPLFRVRAMMSEFQRSMDNGRERAFRARGVFVDGESAEKANFRTHETLVRTETDFADFVARLKNGGQVR
jgi:hypothetical protein